MGSTDVQDISVIYTIDTSEGPATLLIERSESIGMAGPTLSATICAPGHQAMSVPDMLRELAAARAEIDGLCKELREARASCGQALSRTFKDRDAAQADSERLRAELDNVTQERDTLLRGLQALDEANYSAWSENYPTWTPVRFDDGWYIEAHSDDGESGTVLEIHDADMAAYGLTAEGEACRLSSAFNDAMALARSKSEQ